MGQLGKDKKVLIADDSMVVHKLMEKVFASMGFDICCQAKNGREAVEGFKAHNPDLVFLDITMPIVDGIRALRRIINHNPEAKVIMLSAMSDNEIVEQALSIGAKNFISKPFQAEKVKAAVEEVFNGGE